MDTTVNINAIPILSKILGCKSNKGKINNCIRTANTKPLPTSITLSFISFIVCIIHHLSHIVKLRGLIYNGVRPSEEAPGTIPGTVSS